ncbi:MAG: hypothetical protein AAB011_02680 [Candidatus Eisenbacteria bacterium]
MSREEPPAASVDPQDLLWRLQRYGWILVLPVVACLCVATIVARRTVPIYQAFLVVSVDTPADMSPAMRAYAPGAAAGGGPRERIAIVDGKIHNQSFLRAVAERQGMDKDPALLARAKSATKLTPGITPEEYALRLAVGQLWTKISVGQGRGTAIQISVKDANAEEARDLAATIGDALLQQSLQSTLEKVQARGEFSKDQVVVLEERVRQAEDALRTFQESHLHMRITAGISSEAGLQLAQGLRRATEDELAQLRLRILAGNEEWRTLAGGAVMPSLSSTRATDLGAQLTKLEESATMAQLGGRSAQTGEGDALLGRITATRQGLFFEFDRLAQEAGGDLSTEARNTAAGVALDRSVLRSLQARKDRLASAVTTFLSGVQRAPRDEIELQKLQDNVTSARNLLTTMRNESVSSGLSEAMATSQVGPRLQILEPPLLPLTPTSMGASATYAVALFLGLVIDAAIVFAGERLAAVVRTVEQAEAEYGLKVVGVVPRIDTRPKPGGYLRVHWPKFAILAVLLVSALVVVYDEVVSPHPTKSGQVER